LAYRGRYMCYNKIKKWLMDIKRWRVLKKIKKREKSWDNRLRGKR